MYNYVNLCGTTLSLAYLESYPLFGILFKWINFRLITTRCDHLDLPTTALFYLSKFVWLLLSSQLSTQFALTVLCVDALSIFAITAVPMTHPESQPDKCSALLWTAISHAWTHSLRLPVPHCSTDPIFFGWRECRTTRSARRDPLEPSWTLTALDSEAKHFIDTQTNITNPKHADITRRPRQRSNSLRGGVDALRHLHAWSTDWEGVLGSISPLCQFVALYVIRFAMPRYSSTPVTFALLTALDCACLLPVLVRFLSASNNSWHHRACTLLNVCAYYCTIVYSHIHCHTNTRATD